MDESIRALLTECALSGQLDASQAHQHHQAGELRIRMCEGGESVTNGKTTTACDYCSGGVCRQMEACEHRPA